MQQALGSISFNGVKFRKIRFIIWSCDLTDVIFSKLINFSFFLGERVKYENLAAFAIFSCIISFVDKSDKGTIRKVYNHFSSNKISSNALHVKKCFSRQESSYPHSKNNKAICRI